MSDTINKKGVIFMAWHRIPYISNKRHTFNVIRLIATFLFFLGLIGFIVSFANLFHQWDTLSHVKTCFQKSTTKNDIQLCRNYFYDTTGIALSPNSYLPDQAINVMVAFWPLVSVLFWIIIMFLSIFIYNIGDNWHTLVNHHIYKDFSKTGDLPNYLNMQKSPKQKKSKK